MTEFGAILSTQTSLHAGERAKRGAIFRVWATAASRVELVLMHDLDRREQVVPMQEEEHGIFSVTLKDVQPGARYRYRLNGGDSFPDPYSRFQPEGPHGPSQVIDPTSHRWHDDDWRGITLHGQVFYELHVGTFTQEGTFDAAIEKLSWLRDMGITGIEIMPIAEFPGRFNWGYDGVDLFAPFHGHGDYDAFKRFVDAAHGLGIAVILDVVYNHIGPSGNYLERFSKDYFSSIHKNDWGTPYNVDGNNSRWVRQFLLDNVRYWVREFHLDGLRLDATTQIIDNSTPHILAEMADVARAAAGPREIVIIAEDEQQQASRLLSRDAGGFGIDAMWNDDFHHSAQVALKQRRHAYLHDYLGSPQELISATKRGFLFQGQFYHWQQQPRGQRLRSPVHTCIHFLDNHDQVANSLHGLRSNVGTSAAKYRALTALLLLGPPTPQLFMGQEFGATTPFFYFADHEGELRAAVHKGRKEFLSQFKGIATPDASAQIQDPTDEKHFLQSKLNWSEERQDQRMIALHRDLLGIRREDPVLKKQDAQHLDGAVLTNSAFVLRWFDDEFGDRLLVVNLGVDATLHPGPEPLLAPSQGSYWDLAWSSARVAYGGDGVELPEGEFGWQLPGETAVLLVERPALSALES